MEVFYLRGPVVRPAVTSGVESMCESESRERAKGIEGREVTSLRRSCRSIITSLSIFAVQRSAYVIFVVLGCTSFTLNS